MNIYVVTEGWTEAIVYRSWIPLANPLLVPVDHISAVTDNTVHIVSSQGYPFLYQTIDNAIDDVNRLQLFSRLVVVADSEDMTRQEKYSELEDFISQRRCIAEVYIVIQHFCIETWALGNRRIVRRNPTSATLREYKRLHDVSRKDPELLPAKADEALNRSQFAAKYLKVALRDQFPAPVYTKRNPLPLLVPAYFKQVLLRLTSTGHIASFSAFMDAFT